jgi:hypothetical protein
MSTYGNRHTLRDGHIALYTRNNRPVYHARLKIDGHKGYFVKSTKRRSLAEATRVASDLYDDLRYKLRHGLSIETHTFRSIYQRWWEANQNRLSIHRQKYFRGTANRYFLPFFGDKSLEEISEPTFEAYWDWRINYWSSDEGRAKIHAAHKSRTTSKRPYKQKLGNVAKVPAQTTLRMPKADMRNSKLQGSPSANGRHKSPMSRRLFEPQAGLDWGGVDGGDCQKNVTVLERLRILVARERAPDGHRRTSGSQSALPEIIQAHKPVPAEGRVMVLPTEEPVRPQEAHT